MYKHKKNILCIDTVSCEITIVFHYDISCVDKKNQMIWLFFYNLQLISKTNQHFNHSLNETNIIYYIKQSLIIFTNTGVMAMYRTL